VLARPGFVRAACHPPRHLPGRAALSYYRSAATKRRWWSFTSTRINSASRRTQAWIETLFGHIKTEHPHLDLITNLGDLEAELEKIRIHYNTVRLHQGIGYVTPDDEHHGRGQAIRDARVEGMRAAAEARIAFRRQLRQDPP
jgi:hypothetical protein